MSSSSSEDEFNVEALREAVASDFLTDDIYKNTPKGINCLLKFFITNKNITFIFRTNDYK